MYRGFFPNDDPLFRAALALDFSDVEGARRYVRFFSQFGLCKIGQEAMTAGVADALAELVLENGGRVLWDLKGHDIPNTMVKAAVAAVARGFSALTIHSLSEYDAMLAVQEAVDKANAQHDNNLLVIAVTRLTSDNTASDDEMLRRAREARRAGVKAVVASTSDLALLQSDANTADSLTLVPAIRLPGQSADDQARPDTPDNATGAGADVVVIGRAVTGDDVEDPDANVEEIRRRLAIGAQKTSA